MGDFYQHNHLATLHKFENRSLKDLENEITQFSESSPIALVIPSLYSELARPALQKIVDVLKEIPYLSEIIIGLDAADEQEFIHAKEYFSVLPQEHRILWNDGPGIKQLEFRLNEEHIHPGNPGKGKNLWLCIGYLLASGKCKNVIVHDADILTYDAEMLARLVYPVVDPMMSYKYAKGYYYRADEEKVNGRMARLLITPLIRTLKKFFPHNQYLDLLDGFRYLLASEFATTSTLIENIKIPGDWGIELGLLSEVMKNTSPSQICQVEIADRYDHKHQKESFDNPEKGLAKMSFDIARTLFTRLSIDGFFFDEGVLRSIKSSYFNCAHELIEHYVADSRLNGYVFNRYKEEKIVDQLARNIYQAGMTFLNNPNQTPFMPSWKRIKTAIPELLTEFYNIVETDNQ